jgi:hypothetical protein
MPLFLIKRAIPGATASDYDAAVFRAMSCAYEFDGLRWVTSYWDEDGGYSYCVYEAQDADQVEQHSHRAQIACDEVFPIVQVNPADYRSDVAPAAPIEVPLG